MAIRDGMTEVILTLRKLCEAGTADYTLAGVTFWTDEDLQDILDDHRQDVSEQMRVVARYSSGGQAFHDYYFSAGPVERVASGASAFQVYNSAGSLAGTAAYSVNYRAGHVEFTADQGSGAQYAVRARAFNINGAAAEVWKAKAAHYQAAGFDVETDNHNIKRSQLVDRALKMVETFEALSAQSGYGAYGATLIDRTDAY